MEQDTKRPSVPRVGAAKKKPYRKPELVQHGSVTELTAGSGGSNFDPGQSASTKLGGG